jgi:SAM-dependent methyltransferase
MVNNMTNSMKSNWDHFWSIQSKKTGSISHSKQRILSILEKHTINCKTALDAGCGSGFFSRFFISRGITTYALDYSAKALEMTLKVTEGKANIVCADLLGDKLIEIIGDVKFDIVFSDGLFEHFNDDQQQVIMNNFKSVLSENGIIITFVPNLWSPWQIIRPLLMPGIEEKPFIIKQLRSLNMGCGLNVISDGGINTIPLQWSPDRIVGKSFGMLLYTISRI